MPSIISYRKFITERITRELLPPETAQMGAPAWTELATVEGITYVCLPDGVSVPPGQPKEIAASIAPVTLTLELRAAIEKVSPHVRLIEARVREALPEGYSSADEAKLSLTVPNADAISYVERTAKWRMWAQAEKAKLGL